MTNDGVMVLVAEAVSASRRGDVTGVEVACRTLDDAIGHWVDGVFVGGSTLVQARLRGASEGDVVRIARGRVQS